MNKLLTAQQYAITLQEVLGEAKSTDHDLIVNNLISALEENDQLELYESIIQEFEKLTCAESQKIHAEIKTARPLEDNDAALKEINDIIGKHAELEQKVDEGLVGGVVLRIEDKLLDASVKKQLHQLHNSLTKQS